MISWMKDFQFLNHWIYSSGTGKTALEVFCKICLFGICSLLGLVNSNTSFHDGLPGDGNWLKIGQNNLYIQVTLLPRTY